MPMNGRIDALTARSGAWQVFPGASDREPLEEPSATGEYYERATLTAVGQTIRVPLIKGW